MTDRFLESFKAAFVPELRKLSSSIDALSLGQEKIVARLDANEKLAEDRHAVMQAQLAAHTKVSEDRHQLVIQLIAGNQSVVQKQLDLLDKRIEHLEKQIEIVDQDLRSLRTASDVVWSGMRERMHQNERQLDKLTSVLVGRAPSDPLPDR